MEKICVLIPSYNEARTIGAIIDDIRKIDLPVYVVDDGSADETASIAQRAGAIVLKHERNKGKGASLREGFGRILNDGFDAVMVMDGDGQHETAEICSFIEKMAQGEADIVIGNRMWNAEPMPLERKLTNKFMSYIISLLCKYDIPDTQCGFRLIKSKVLKGICLESSNYEIESEMLLKAARKRFRIESVPIKAVYKDEQSGINPVIDTFRFLALLVKTAGK